MEKRVYMKFCINICKFSAIGILIIYHFVDRLVYISPIYVFPFTCVHNMIVVTVEPDMASFNKEWDLIKLKLN